MTRVSEAKAQREALTGTVYSSLGKGFLGSQDSRIAANDVAQIPFESDGISTMLQLRAIIIGIIPLW